MNLTVWDKPSDPFDYEEIASNFVKIANHDHSNGKGKKIQGSGIDLGAIDTNHIADGAINEDKIADFSVKRNKIDNLAINADKIEDGAITPEKLSNELSLLSPDVTSLLPETPQDGEEIYYDWSGTGDYWHLKCFYADINQENSTYQWKFLGGPPAGTYQGLTHKMDSSGGTGNPGTDDIEIINEMDLLVLPPGFYTITFNALLDFKYQSVSAAEFRTYLYNTPQKASGQSLTATSIATSVIAPPLTDGNTQLAVPVSRTIQYASVYSLQLRLRARTAYRQVAGNDSSKFSYLNRGSIVATPHYILPANKEIQNTNAYDNGGAFIPPGV